MPEQYLGQNQELRQEQILAPQQIQSLEVLLAPLLELQEKLTQELENNPVIELEKNFNEELVGDTFSGASEAADSQTPQTDDDDWEINELIKLGENWHDYLPPAHNHSDNSDEDKKRDFIFNSQIEQPSLQDDLMEQLRLSDAAPDKAAIAENIIGNIDETGYFSGNIEDTAASVGASNREVEDVLHFVQSFDPPGIGARNLQECLILQLERRDKPDRKLISLIKNHLHELARNKLPQVAKAMKVSVEEIVRMQAKIKELNPYPGSAASSGKPMFVVPELKVENHNGEFVLSADDNVPQLKISKTYLDLLENPDTPKETRDYIREKLLSGKMLIRSLEQRQSTLRRIAQVIIDSQYDFFAKGIEYLRPLTMLQVADKLGLHETTISRAISNKYIQTPYGLFEFKFFFTGGYQTGEGDELSSRSVKEMIRDIISREDPAKPLSDNKISAMLEEKGLKVARRTVAKYREELGIPATSLRKEFN